MTSPATTSVSAASGSSAGSGGSGVISLDAHLSRRQSLAWRVLHDDDIREVLYGGAKGGGKSVFGVIWSFARALEIIQEHNLTPSPRPLPVGWIGRKQSVDFSNTTLETWRRFIPPKAYTLKEQAKEIVIADTVKIDFGGLDRGESVQKFNSAEYAFFFLDQAEEVSVDDVSALRASLRLIINKTRPRYKQLFTANPRRCWLKSEFIDQSRPDQRYIQALPADNPHLGDEYIETLRNAFSHRPELLRAYLDGSWDAFDSDDQVIRDVWIQSAGHRINHPTPMHKIIVCDVARFGDDETVIYTMEDTEITAETVYGQKDTMHTANVLFRLQHDLGGCLVAVDDIGVGGGVVDRLKEMGVRVMAINSAAAAADPERYYNLRAEMWMEASREFAGDDVALHHDDRQLHNQLCTPTYQFRGTRLLIEAKSEIKVRTGRSPDRGDAYIMGLAALRWLKHPGMRQSPGLIVHDPVDAMEIISRDPRTFAGRSQLYREDRAKQEQDQW